jgi:hypothetical protein
MGFVIKIWKIRNCELLDDPFFNLEILSLLRLFLKFPIQAKSTNSSVIGDFCMANSLFNQIQWKTYVLILFLFTAECLAMTSQLQLAKY